MDKNFLLNLKKEFDSGTITKEQYIHRLNKFIELTKLTFEIYFSKLIDSIYSGKEDEISKTASKMITGYKKALIYAEKKDENVFNEMLKSTDDCIKEFKKITDDSEFNQMLKKPTNISYINFLINSILFMINKNYPEDIFKPALDLFNKEVSRIKLNFEEFKNKYNNSAEKEAIESISLGLNKYDEIKKSLELFKTRRAINYLDDTLKELVEMAGYFEKSHKIIEDFEIRKNQIQCIKCGHLNPKSKSNCEKCNFKLPQIIEDEEEYIEIPMDYENVNKINIISQNVKNLIDNAQLFKDAKITDIEFINKINDLKLKTEKAYGQIQNSDFESAFLEPDPNRDPETVSEIKEKVIKAIDQFIDGLTEFEEYVKTKNEDTHQNAVNLLMESSLLLYRFIGKQ